jgi:hypothetical protein
MDKLKILAPSSPYNNWFCQKENKEETFFLSVVFTPKTRENSKLKAIIREI